MINEGVIYVGKVSVYPLLIEAINMDTVCLNKERNFEIVNAFIVAVEDENAVEERI